MIYVYDILLTLSFLGFIYLVYLYGWYTGEIRGWYNHREFLNNVWKKDYKHIKE
jgi:hypothetical protein